MTFRVLMVEVSIDDALVDKPFFPFSPSLSSLSFYNNSAVSSSSLPRLKPPLHLCHRLCLPYLSTAVMASEVALSQDGQRPNELGNEPKQEHVSTRPSLEDQSNEGKPPKNTALIIFCILCITFISCYLGGLVTVSVPAISKDLSLDPGVELWSVSLVKTSRGKGTCADGTGRYPCMPLRQNALFSFQEPCRTLLGAALSSSSHVFSRAFSAWPVSSRQQELN